MERDYADEAPASPVQTVLLLFVEPLDLSIAEAAARLYVEEGYLPALLEGRDRATAGIAVRLE